MGVILNIVIDILIGALVGWVAGLIMKSKGGFWRNAIMGIIGGFVGGLIPIPFVGAVLGACLVIFVYEKFIVKSGKKGKKRR